MLQDSIYHMQRSISINTSISTPRRICPSLSHRFDLETHTSLLPFSGQTLSLGHPGGFTRWFVGEGGREGERERGREEKRERGPPHHQLQAHYTACLFRGRDKVRICRMLYCCST